MHRSAGLLLALGACTANAPSGPGPEPDAPPPTPTLTLSADASIATTDLGVDLPFTATLTSTNGFSAPVTVAAAAPPGWNVTFDESLIDVPANSSVMAQGHLTVDGDAAELTAQITVSVDRPIEPVTIAASANPTLTVTWKLDAAMHAVYDADHLQANPYKLKAGRTIKVVNGGDQPMTVHVDGITGFPTETTPTAPNDSYARIVTTSGDAGQFFWDTLDAAPTDESTHPHLTVTP